MQEDLLSAKRRLESQETQILSLEAALSARPLLPPDAPEDDKDKLIAELQRTNRELTFVVQGYEENLGEPLRAVKEDVEKEWKAKVEILEQELEGSKEWVKEVLKELEKEKQVSSSNLVYRNILNLILICSYESSWRKRNEL